MRNLSKRAISILVIVTFLMSMIPIMPTQAALTVDVSGIQTRTADPWADGPSATEPVTVSTAQAQSGSNSLMMTTGSAINTDYSRIVITLATPVPLQEFVEPTIWMYASDAANYGGSYNASSGLPEAGGDTFFPFGNPYINILIDEDGTGGTSEKLEAMGTMAGGDPDDQRSNTTWTEMQEGWGYYDTIGGGVMGSPYNRTLGGTWWPGTLAQWKTWASTYMASATVTGIEITYGMWGEASLGPVYVDDVLLNGTTYTYETAWNDKGDTLAVSGLGVTAGSVVNVYWDFVNAAGLKNNTEANPDGTYDVEIDVPSDVGGNHYIWIKDVETGTAIMYPNPIFVWPKITVSPTSGLVGDEITVKGYGFSDESDVALTFNGTALTTSPSSIETDEDGYFTATFDIPASGYATHTITALDDNTLTDSVDLIVGASITLTPDEGPTGTIVTVAGRGWNPDRSMSFAIGATTAQVVDGNLIEVDSDGEFTAEVVIPNMGGVDEYELAATENGSSPQSSTEDFDITGIPEIVVSPTYGAPGATITVTGSNFTQISGTDVDIDLTPLSPTRNLVTAETNADGAFTTTFVSPAVIFDPYNVSAVDDYDLDAVDAFKVGLIALIINPTSGESGTAIGLTGIGFANGVYNVTFGALAVEEDYGTVTSEAISDTYYAPNIAPGIYNIVVIDTDENELTVQFTVTESTTASVDPVVAPNLYNVSIEGTNFGDAAGAVTFEIYNSTDDWVMNVDTDPGNAVTSTNTDGNFSGYWMIPASTVISNGDYTINITGSQGLLMQLDFSVVAARVQVTPRKALFDRGDTVSFDISNDFELVDATIEIYSPDDTLYWITGVLDNWVLVDTLYTVPYYSQLANSNPMELAGDAPLGTWTYFCYEGTDELMNGTFVVGPSVGAQVDELLADVRSDISGLADDLAGITDNVEADIAALSGEIAGVASDLSNLADDIVSDLAGDIADATDAGQAALNAVEDLADSMSDLGNAVSDIADVAADSAAASQSAADAANDAVDAAQAAQNSASGLTTLVYGAIGASLKAALAAIVSLMQISKRIAG